jgi:DNA uptake protein ComE-like DNA-binding protein
LTLGAMAFFERTFAEHRASRSHGRQLQARHYAESGVEYIKTVISQSPVSIRESGGLYANPGLFQGVIIVDDPLAELRGQFTVVAPDQTTDGLYGGIRHGLENESSRLNLNTVLFAESGNDRDQGAGPRKLLMTLPGMTEPMADAILDWIDPDDEPRMLGAEREFYSTLSPPYAPRNGPLGSIEELLMVRDVTPALLFGPDLNRNSGIDHVEEPLTVIDNADNSMGLLDRGWSAYITLDSAESNLRPDGTPKIDVNKEDLQELHQELVDALGLEMANFIVAYRQGGAYKEDGSGSAKSAAQSAANITLDFTQPGRERLNSILDLIGVRTRIAKTNQSNGNTDGKSQAQNGASGGSGSGSNDGGKSGGQSESSNDDSRTIVEAAFPDQPGAMRSYLTKLMDNIAVNSNPTIPGRLNINQAPRRLLNGIPGLDQMAVDQIISQRDITLGDQQPEQVHETWLLTQGVVELKDMKKLIGLVTTGGNVYRAQVIGGYFNGGPAERLEVVIDATEQPPVVRRRMELRGLGQGYSAETLGAKLDDVP